MREILNNMVPESILKILRDRRSRYRGKELEQVFSEIYRQGRWQKDRTGPVSGPGSSLPATEQLRMGLQAFFRQQQITRVTDLGCGDFSWFQTLDLAAIDYLGYDVVEEIIEQNRSLYASETTRFERARADQASIGCCDLVICRDCLVHLAFSEIQPVLKNLRESEARWVGLTHFPGVSRNVDILTGQWRPLNLCLEPFSFGPPWRVIGDNLGQTEVERVLGIWVIDQMPEPKPA